MMDYFENVVRENLLVKQLHTDREGMCTMATNANKSMVVSIWALLSPKLEL